jgi:hypothetical protein
VKGFGGPCNSFLQLLEVRGASLCLCAHAHYSRLPCETDANFVYAPLAQARKKKAHIRLPLVQPPANPARNAARVVRGNPSGNSTYSDATGNSPPMPLPDGRFERVRLLGRGSFGTVTLVKDMWNGERFVALKRISPPADRR